MSKNRESKCYRCHGKGVMTLFLTSRECWICSGSGKVKERYSLSKKKWVRV